MKNNQIKIGALLSYSQMFLNIVISLIYTPIMIRLLGRSEFGLYNTVASAIAMLSLLNLGFSSGYIRYFSRYKSNDDETAIWKLNGLFMIIFCVIGIVALICGTFLSCNLELIFDRGLNTIELQIAKRLMILLTINLAISFPMSVFSNIITANEKFIFLKTLGMIKSICSPIISLPLLLLGYGSLGIVLSQVVIALFVDLINCCYVIFKLKYKFIFRGFEKGIFVGLFSYTAFIAINMVIDQVNWNLDKILLGSFSGTAIVALYSVGASLQSYFQLFSTAISGVFTPRIHAIENSKEHQDKKNRLLSELFIKIGRIQYIILALMLSGFLFFGKAFVYFWAGTEYVEAYYVALLLMFPVMIPLIQNLGIEIQRSLNKHKFRSIIYAAMAIVNLIVTICLIPKYGALGAAFGTALSLVFANGIIMNIYYYKACNIDIILFWKNILRVSLGLVVPITCGLFISYAIDLYSPLKLICSIIVYAILYGLSMFYMGISQVERESVMHYFRKIHLINADKS